MSCELSAAASTSGIMESMAASPLLRRETSKLRRQSLQFSATMTLKESPNRLKRCATPWQMDLEHSVSDATWGLERISERPLSRSSSCSSLTHSQTFGASICRSPAPSLNSTDSGGADSLDSFLEEAITTHGSPSRSRKDHMHLWQLERANQSKSEQRSQSCAGSLHQRNRDCLQDLHNATRWGGRSDHVYLASH
mmetsp:Transcript_65265/g.102785  ORF Transcript_65265/g.102785 Transcript_65265/m.102785 type:complete len:195 (-) Transcript_65265:180-764(-)